MNIQDAMLKRQSIRQFLNKEVDINVVKKIISLASYSPSGANLQPWKVAITNGDNKKELSHKLQDAFWKQEKRAPDYQYYPLEMPDSYKKRRYRCGEMLYNSIDIDKNDKKARLSQWAKNYDSFGAPISIYIFIDKIMATGSYMDSGMFIHAISLLALDFGLATCLQAALSEYPNIVKKHFDDYYDCNLLCGIALGYPDFSHDINNYRTDREDISSFCKVFD